MLDKETGDYGLKPLQQKIMNIMDHVHTICEKHNLRYYAIGGTAIGAVRHRGFIPWDDDLDIIMPYEDYKQFIEICETDLDQERFYLQKEFTKELPKPFCKVRMNNTTYIEKVNPDNGMHQGIFIDVMCMHKSPDNEFLRKLQFLAAKLVAARGLAMVDYSPGNRLKKLFISFASMLPKKFVFGAVSKFIASWNSRDTKTVSHIYGRAGYNASFYPADLVGEPRYLPFEGSKIAVFEHVEQFLTIRFGDFMQLPPEKERLAAQHAQKVDLDNDYTMYTSKR